MKRNKGAEEVLYTKDYKIHQEDSRRSAKEIIPLVLELIQPKRVIDLGCGVGVGYRSSENVVLRISRG